MADRQSGFNDFVVVPVDATLDQDFVIRLLFIEIIECKGLLGDCDEQANWLEAFLKFDFVKFTARQLNLLPQHFNQVKVLYIIFKSIMLVKYEDTSSRKAQNFFVSLLSDLNSFIQRNIEHDDGILISKYVN